MVLLREEALPEGERKLQELVLVSICFLCVLVAVTEMRRRLWSAGAGSMLLCFSSVLFWFHCGLGLKWRRGEAEARFVLRGSFLGGFSLVVQENLNSNEATPSRKN